MFSAFLSYPPIFRCTNIFVFSLGIATLDVHPESHLHELMLEKHRLASFLLLHLLPRQEYSLPASSNITNKGHDRIAKDMT